LTTQTTVSWKELVLETAKTNFPNTPFSPIELFQSEKEEYWMSYFPNRNKKWIQGVRDNLVLLYKEGQINKLGRGIYSF
jgi:hypothetical protein